MSLFIIRIWDYIQGSFMVSQNSRFITVDELKYYLSTSCGAFPFLISLKNNSKLSITGCWWQNCLVTTCVWWQNRCLAVELIKIRNNCIKMQNKFQIIFSYFSYHSKFRCNHFIFSEAPTIQMTNNVTEGDLWKIKWNVTFPGADNIESVIITYKEVILLPLYHFQSITSVDAWKTFAPQSP